MNVQQIITKQGQYIQFLEAKISAIATQQNRLARVIGESIGIVLVLKAKGIVTDEEIKAALKKIADAHDAVAPAEIELAGFEKAPNRTTDRVAELDNTVASATDTGTSDGDAIQSAP